MSAFVSLCFETWPESLHFLTCYARVFEFPHFPNKCSLYFLIYGYCASLLYFLMWLDYRSVHVQDASCIPKEKCFFCLFVYRFSWLLHGSSYLLFSKIDDLVHLAVIIIVYCIVFITGFESTLLMRESEIKSRY